MVHVPKGWTNTDRDWGARGTYISGKRCTPSPITTTKRGDCTTTYDMNVSNGMAKIQPKHFSVVIKKFPHFLFKTFKNTLDINTIFNGLEIPTI